MRDVVDRIVETATNALEMDVAQETRCTCPQDMLQQGIGHFVDCPSGKRWEKIERVVRGAIMRALDEAYEDPTGTRRLLSNEVT